MTQQHAEKTTSAKIAVALSLSVYVEHPMKCTGRCTKIKREQLKIHNYDKFCQNCSRAIYVDQEYIVVKAKRNNDGEYFHKDYHGCVDSTEPSRDATIRQESRVWSLH
jgi:hypothetical protein